MTTEPRQEAERLVWEYRQLCESDRPFHDENGHNALESGLVDALAAAIEDDAARYEYHKAMGDGDPNAAVAAARRWTEASDWLERALSALREDTDG